MVCLPHPLNSTERHYPMRGIVMMKRLLRALPQTTRPPERGQAMVEAAISLIFLLIMLSALVDFGRLFFTYLALNNAAAEGAYYGTTFPMNEDAADSDDPNNIIYRTQNEVPSDLNQLIDWSDATILVEFESPVVPRVVGSDLTVRIIYPFRMIGPLPGLIGWNGQFNIQATATQTILTNTAPEN